jgi:hypothetical protein
MSVDSGYLQHVTRLERIEQEALLMVNCARLAHGAPPLPVFPAVKAGSGRTPVSAALEDVVPFVKTVYLYGPWYLRAPAGSKGLRPVAGVWQTSTRGGSPVGHVQVRCPRRVSTFLREFENGQFPHLIEP